MARKHLVWDWNGTLLDDLPVVVEAVSQSIGRFGLDPITADDYRDHYTRPVRHFYDNLFGRSVEDDEWEHLNATFHDVYFDLAAEVGLTSGALEAMELLDEAGWGQSLLSMSPHDWLTRIVDRLQLTHRLALVDGLTEVTGGLKAGHMEQHLRMLGIDGESVVAIGDTPDDAAAAAHVGAGVVLFHGGSHHIEVLEAEGVPVAETLVEAVELALSQ